MGNRTAKFTSALLASIIAGAPLSAVSQSAPNAAEDCLAAPKGATPEGQHWYYRIERGTKRQCWYLREEGAAKEGTKESTKTAQAPANPQKANAPAPHTLQDARAELTASQPAPAQNTTPSLPAQPAPWPAATLPQSATGSAAVQGPLLAQRWPDASNVAQAQPAQMAPAAPSPAVPETDEQAAPAPQVSTPPAPAALAAAAVPVDKPTGSLQTLFLVIGAALTLAGITGSLIYRFAGARSRSRTNTGARRRANWDSWDQGKINNSHAPWADTVQDYAPRTKPPSSREPSPIPATSTGPATIREIDVPERPAADSVDIDALALEIEQLTKEAGLAPAGAPAETIAPEPAAAEAADDDIDIDVITQMLERLAQEGPRLSPIAAGPADLEQSRPARSGARA
ncbi:hypothetical protein [Bradyrhizobium sp.]|uniref:hypothetical protein n=1 Tax=Bradyrhizobium sp. TaxID=376 RepID=UPI0023977757|nr:hypothetical protein [Bradyrhizobium sp.]MDE2378995.1 hypothetical protein [Bradyrhizobium sp.]